jgi:hypothetical protein
MKTSCRMSSASSGSDFLQDVLGVVGIGDPAPDEAEEPPAVVAPEGLELSGLHRLRPT